MDKIKQCQARTTGHYAKNDGHAAGSGDLSDAHGGTAGRIYMTCLCIMTGDVYDRHQPLYGVLKVAESNGEVPESKSDRKSSQSKKK